MSTFFPRNGKEYIPRVIDATIMDFLATFGAVCVEGPKWCGKTWASLNQAHSAVMIGDPANNFQNRELAKMNPGLILEGAVPRLIDEWQEVPSIWDAVRFEVDNRGTKGQFLLTGSATPNRKGVLHSGAGRIATLRMRPMSLYESGDSNGVVSLLEICNGSADSIGTGNVELQQLIDLIVRGGWPESTGLSVERAAQIAKSYIKTVIAEDVNRIDEGVVNRSQEKMELLLRSLARNESTTASGAVLRSDMEGIDRETLDEHTVADYLDVFRRLFLVDDQPPFSWKLRSSIRLKQSAKRHLADPSLAVALLKATPKKLLNDLNTLGFLFEAMVERDLRIYCESWGGELYHYQDYKNREVDAVIEMPDGGWCAIEIKLGANQIEEAAANLTKLRDALARESTDLAPRSLIVVCGLSHAAYQRPDGVIIVPVTALKP